MSYVPLVCVFFLVLERDCSESRKELEGQSTDEQSNCRVSFLEDHLCAGEAPASLELGSPCVTDSLQDGAQAMGPIEAFELKLKSREERRTLA